MATIRRKIRMCGSEGLVDSSSEYGDAGEARDAKTSEEDSVDHDSWNVNVKNVSEMRLAMALRRSRKTTLRAKQKRMQKNNIEKDVNTEDAVKMQVRVAANINDDETQQTKEMDVQNATNVQGNGR